MALEMTVTVVGDKRLIRTMQGLKGFFKSRELRRVLEDAKNTLVRVARNESPKRSRLLSRSIGGRVEGFGSDNPRVRMGSSVSYAPVVELGSKPHPIFPRNKKTLFWTVYDSPQTRAKLKGAALVFSFWPGGMHPGTKPQPFMKPAYGVAKPRLMAALLRIVRSKLRGEA